MSPAESITLFPVVHGRLEFAAAVRRRLEQLDPAAVAVELPSTLEEAVLRGVDRLPLLSIVRTRQEDGRPSYLLIEPADPIIEALRWARERGRPVALVDLDLPEVRQVHEALPDPYAITRIGYEAFIEAYRAARPLREGEERAPDDALREQAMAHATLELAARHGKVALVLGLAHDAAVAALLERGEGALPFRRMRRPVVELLHLGRASSREVLAEPPFLEAAYERARAGGGPALEALDRRRLTVQLLQEAREGYRKNQGEELSPATLRMLLKFLRNYALVEQRLAPDLYQILVAARAAVDDDFAYEVWERAGEYPFQTEHPQHEVIELSIEDLYENSRYLRFRRSLRRKRKLLRLVRPRLKEQRPGEWAEAWKGQGICSFPPEDLVVENFGAFLRKKAEGLLAAEDSRVEPFTTSLLDGIDLRETIRNWHEGRLYVREHRRIKGKVGAVVLVFDERDLQERYSWRLTWQGEHDQESDMALYSTPPEQFVGPGIARCEYGGFVMSFPPGRMYDVWDDPYYDFAQTPAERLLMAGLDYSEERMVLYVAASPPRSVFYSLAARLQRKLVYLPLGQLSPVTLKQIRVFHVLDGHHVRSLARDLLGS